MTATKFTVAFLCRLPIIDGRTTMKAPFFSPAFCLITSLITACSSPSGPNAWTPVTSGPPRAPIPQNEVLVIDEYPMGEYTNVGHFNGPEGRIVHVSMEDKELIDYFTKEAAAMGGNTVVIREPRIRYRSGEGKSSRVDVIYVREEMGTHGAEDLGMDSLPIGHFLPGVFSALFIGRTAMRALRTGIPLLHIKPESAYPALELAPPIQERSYPSHSQANRHHSAKTAGAQ